MAMLKGFPTHNAQFDARDIRYDLAGLVYRNKFGNARDGLLWPVPGKILTSRPDMAVDVNNFNAIAVRDGGPVFLANRGLTRVPLDAAPVTGSRIDVLYAKQNDNSTAVSSPDANVDSVLGVVKGEAAALPYKPQGLPLGAVELGTVTIPAGATSTQAAGISFTNSSKFTALSGQPIPCYDEDQGLIGQEASSFDRVMRLDKGGMISTWLEAGVENNHTSAGWYEANSQTTRFRDLPHVFTKGQITPVLFNKAKTAPAPPDFSYNGTTGTLTTVRPGLYFIKFMWTMSVQGVNVAWEASIEINGDPAVNQGPWASNAISTAGNLMHTQFLNIGDTIRVSVYAGQPIGFDTSRDDRTMLDIVRLGGLA